MSALLSAIHNTGNYRVRARPVCLSPCCVRSASNGQNQSSSLRRGVARLANMMHLRSPTKLAQRLQYVCTETAARPLRLVFADRNLAKDGAGLARRRAPTGRWRVKAAPPGGSRAGDLVN